MTADRDLIVSDTIANKIRGYMAHVHAMILHLSQKIMFLLFQVVDDAEIVLKEYSEEVKQDDFYSCTFNIVC